MSYEKGENYWDQTLFWRTSITFVRRTNISTINKCDYADSNTNYNIFAENIIVQSDIIKINQCYQTPNAVANNINNLHFII